MMKKILNIFSLIVVFLFILAVYGWMVNQIGKGGKKFGVLTQPIKTLYSFPNLFQETVKEVNKLPETFIPTPEKFNPINKLKKDVNVLISYPNKEDDRIVAVLNLRNDSILKQWEIKNPSKSHVRIMHPYLYDNGSLLLKFNVERPGLIMLDTSGKKVWQNNTLVPHHGMNLDSAGNIWACTYRRGMSGGVYYLGGEEVRFDDFRITKYDKRTGKILFDKSITGILKENGLANYILKTRISKDPLHLNDVQPALKTTKFYQEDDVFISLRNISIILHYRPSTHKVINLIEGPFVHQHDVDFLNDSTLVLFNNNTFRTWPKEYITKSKRVKNKNKIAYAGYFHSNIVSYNLNTKSFSTIGNELFKQNMIHSTTEGLVEFLDSTTYFVEEQNSGVLWVIEDDKVVYKNVIKSFHKGHHHLPNWTRIIQYGDKDFR